MAAITTAVVGAGAAIYSAKKQSDAQKKALQSAEQAQKNADPYAQYRAGAASQLNAMSQSGYSPSFDGINQGLSGLQGAMANATSKDNLYGPVKFDAPTVSAGGEVGSLQSYSQPYMTAILAAREQSAQRQSAAQGYTGSGNALIAAANAGTEATMYGYQLGEQDRAAAQKTRQLQFDASYANAGFGLQNNQLYAQQLMSANDNTIRQGALGLEGAGMYLNSMYQNENLKSNAYNNRFNQLAMLSGADVGIQSAAGVSGAVSSGQQNVGAGQAGLSSSIGSGITGILGAGSNKGWW